MNIYFGLTERSLVHRLAGIYPAIFFLRISVKESRGQPKTGALKQAI